MGGQCSRDEAGLTESVVVFADVSRVPEAEIQASPRSNESERGDAHCPRPKILAPPKPVGDKLEDHNLAGDELDKSSAEPSARLSTHTEIALKYSPPHAPFLFSEAKRRNCYCCRFGRSEEKETRRSDSGKSADPSIHTLLGNVELKYDMWVMPVLKLMELEQMEPHQVLITKGLILRWRPVMKGRIIFVSHQWLGFTEPDPDRVHLRALQRVLRRLMQGDIAEVRMDYKRKDVAKGGISVKVEEWVAALPHMYVWVDYISMPQVSVAVPADAVNTSAHKRFAEQSGHVASLSVSYAIKIAEKQGRSPGSPDLPVHSTISCDDFNLVQHQDAVETNYVSESSDHRYNLDETALDLRDAVSSIPAYVALSSMILVLAPVCKHHDTSSIADYSTWRKRGWCRMELAAASLAPHKLPMMLVTGVEQDPSFMMPLDAIFLPPGTGNFSCCAMNHLVGNTPIPCDKEKVRAVMEALISCKLDQLTRDGLDFDRCVYASFRKLYLSGLPDIDLDSGKPNSVASLKRLLRFDAHTDLVSNPSKGLRLLLQLAIQYDAIQVIRELLETCKCDLNAIGFPLVSIGMPALPMLSLAMGFSSPDVVCELLDRRADPTVKITSGSTSWIKGLTPFQMAVFRAKEDNIRAWMQYFPNYEVKHDDRNGFLGLTYMHVAAIGAVHAGPSMIKTMLELRAHVSTKSYAGGTPLHIVVGSSVDCREDIVNELLRNGADVNSASIPQTRLFKQFAWICRKTVKVGDSDSLKVTMAIQAGSTPLHHAAKLGNLVAIEALLKARADPKIRNTMGHTPLDIAAWMFREVPQPILDLLK